MKSTSAQIEMHKIFLEEEGPVLANDTLTSILYIVLTDIENEGLKLDDAVLEERMSKELEKIKKARP